MIVWRDGAIVEGEGAVAANDRGWLVGDAIFETILVQGGAPAFLEDHLARLNRGLETLRFNRRMTIDDVRCAIADLMAAGAPARRSALRLTLSRAGGRRGLLPSSDATARATAFLTPVEPVVAGWKAVVARQRRWTGSAAIGFKSPGAYLDNMIARLEASDAGADEAIMLNEFGRVACATASNLFLATGDRLATPPAAEGAMPGVVRSVVLAEAARLGVKTSEEAIDPARLAEGEILLTNSIAGVVRTTLVGREAAPAGAVAAAMVDAYARRLAAETAANGSAA